MYTNFDHIQGKKGHTKETLAMIRFSKKQKNFGE